MSKVRLDQLVFDKGYTDSRERAKAVIMSGNVFVSGQRADKPGMQVSPDAIIDVKIKDLPFVSRGGYKLDKALKVFPISAEGVTAIDCGASTGGFTDVLLQHGARKVYAVDVGYGQLAWKLRNDERVVNFERTNLRYITKEQIPEEIDLAVCDVSFISLKLILPSVQKLLVPDGDMICLIKPQFEAGRELVGKKGVVRDPKVHMDVIESVIGFAESMDFSVCGLDYSPVKGPEGNIEYLLWLKNGCHERIMPDIGEVVRLSHMNLESIQN